MTEMQVEETDKTEGPEESEGLEEIEKIEDFEKKLKPLTQKALFSLSETVRKEIDKLTRDISALKMKRENWNREAKDNRNKRDSSVGISSGDLDELRTLADENKRLRDETNKQIQLLKKERDHLTEAIREEWETVRHARNDFRGLQSETGPLPNQINEEIERLEWKQQTTPNISLEEENALVEQITDLYGKVAIATTMNDAYERMQGSIDRANATMAVREKIHQQVVELAQKSQQYHENMIQTYQQMDELRQKGGEYHEQFLIARKNADAVHKEVVSLQDRIRHARQKVNLINEETDNRKRRKIMEKTSIERDAAQKKVSAGNRITLDELRLILDSKSK